MGCEGVSFEPITAYAKGAADPHHVTDDSRGKRGDCVILDIGAFKNNYASDLTRTVFIGEVSDRAKEIYDIVAEANRRGIEAARPGNRMCDVDAACRDYITEKGFGPYFTHRTGHSIGLEDHEFGDVSSVNEDIIKPGQCFSVEREFICRMRGSASVSKTLCSSRKTDAKYSTTFQKTLSLFRKSRNRGITQQIHNAPPSALF